MENETKGINLAAQGKFNEAKIEFEKALKANPSNGFVINSIKFIEEVNNGKAEKKTAIYWFKAQSNLIKGLWDEAIIDFNKAIDTNPANVHVYYNNRGSAYSNSGQYDHAISDFNKAIEINPSYASAFNNRAVAYYYMGEYDKALQDVNKSQSLDFQVHPGFLKALHEAQENRTFSANEMSSDEKGLAAFKGGDYPTALRYWLPEAKKGNAVSQLNVGHVYLLGLEDEQEALKWYRKSAEQGHEAAQFALGLAYFDGLGISTDFKEAAYWLQKAADQGHASAQFNLGKMYFDGDGITQNFIKAYFWFELSTKSYQKIIDDGFDMKKPKKDAVSMRKKAAKKLTRSQKKKAMQMVNDWRPKER